MCFICVYVFSYKFLTHILKSGGWKEGGRERESNGQNKWMMHRVTWGSSMSFFKKLNFSNSKINYFLGFYTLNCRHDTKEADYAEKFMKFFFFLRILLGFLSKNLTSRNCPTCGNSVKKILLINYTMQK